MLLTLQEARLYLNSAGCFMEPDGGYEWRLEGRRIAFTVFDRETENIYVLVEYPVVTGNPAFCRYERVLFKGEEAVILLGCGFDGDSTDTMERLYAFHVSSLPTD